jgi:ATP-dependent DNA helicase RecQ
LKIIEIRKYLKSDVPFIALTASATPEVQDDIVDKLGLKNVQKFSLSYERKNISYSCIEVEDKLSKTLKILQKINGSAIVYTRNRLKTVEIAKYLLANKISADYYHAGLPYRDREQKQERWTAGHIRVMVATNAFGMGIDKPDVRVVIHVDLPDSLEAYYQEAGRAGRDTQKAYATILYQPGDIEELLARPLEYQFDESQLKYTYQALANYYKVAAGDVENSFDFNIEDFCKVFNLKVIDTYKNIKQLSYLGLLELNEAFYSSPLLYVPSQTDLYRYQVENKKFEPIIKNILRLYGGEIFAVPTKISEKKIAQLSNVSEENIIKFLTYLDKLTIVHYSPKRDKPLLTFVGHRQDVKTLKIDKVKNNWRKEILTIKVNALKDYILNKACRTKMILAYFGENDYQQCNNCDYCVNKNREDLANYYPKAKEIILELLKHNALDMKSITLNLSTFNTMAYQYAIQKMLDQNILTYNEKGQLTIKS